MSSDARKIHVMHVVDSLEVGGMENGVVNIANNIDKVRFKFSICCLSHPGALSKRINDDRVQVHSLQWKGGFSPGLFLKLAGTFRKQKVEIIHTHGWLTLLYSSVASKLAGVSVLINGEHGTFHLNNSRRKIAYKIISIIVDRYVSVSYSLERELADVLNIAEDKIVTIPNGVDLRKFSAVPVEAVSKIKAGLGIPDSAFVIGSVGRLEPVKNYEMLLNVFAKLCSYVSDIHCVLIGDGSMRSTLESLADQLGVGAKVHFTGKVDNPHQVMSILDIFVCSSFSEGMSNTVLEAMACGKPIVATNVGDNGKLVDDGCNGILVQSEDATGLEKALTLLISDKEMLQKFGTCSRKLAEEKYDILKMVSSYQDVYLQSVADSRGTYDV